jgi:hypothetical protein
MAGFRDISSTRTELRHGPVFSSRLVIEEVISEAPSHCVFNINNTTATGQQKRVYILSIKSTN